MTGLKNLVSEVDLEALRNAQLEIQFATKRLEQAAAQDRAVKEYIWAKYIIGPTGMVKLDTGEIVRVPSDSHII